MSSIVEKTIDVIERLDEAGQIIVYKFAEFLANENEIDDDVRLYDEAKSNDDGYRISSESIKAKYGL